MFKKFMSKKRNKKRGFTLIELIIVIAIIAILAAIAVPAFGQIREKANVSADLGNARTIYSVITAGVADESILLPATEDIKYYKLESVGRNGVSILDSTPGVETPKTYQQYAYYVGLNQDGDIEIVVAPNSSIPTTNGENDKVYSIYPKGEGRYTKAEESE